MKSIVQLRVFKVPLTPRVPPFSLFGRNNVLLAWVLLVTRDARVRYVLASRSLIQSIKKKTVRNDCLIIFNILPSGRRLSSQY